MLTLTDNAASRLGSILQECTQDDQKVVRMIREDGRFKLRVDTVRDGDVTFLFQDRVVLALHSNVAATVASRQLGVRSIDGRPRLRFARQ